MTSVPGPSSSPLRLFVDKERNRVVVGEASGDFIDPLLSFLTLPLGNIIRLLSNEQTHGSAEVGCINNLYQSVKNSDTQVFWNKICKMMLLRPRNPCGKLCKKLKLNVDDTQTTKYLTCGSCGPKLLSTFAGANCSSCGMLMAREIKLKNEDDDYKGDGVFVRSHSKFLIFDDLTVLQNTPGNTLKQLTKLGYTDLTKLTEISLKVGLNQIMDLFKRAFVSKSPLTDVFFLNVEDDGSKCMASFRPVLAMGSSQSESDSSLQLKITVRKSTNKIMYAEAEADFTDFLFSFLTMPLGSILKLLHGNNVTLGSIQNLYQSVIGLSSITVTGLLDLKVASQYGCMRQPLKLVEQEIPIYSTDSFIGIDNGLMCVSNRGGTLTLVKQTSSMKLFDPRSADGSKEAATGFVRRPSLFAVMDDLQVLSLTSASSVSFLQKMNIPLDDLEEHEVKIGMTEALNLLGASLTSKTALTNGFSNILKKPKKEEAKNDLLSTESVGSIFDIKNYIDKWSFQPPVAVIWDGTFKSFYRRCIT